MIFHRHGFKQILKRDYTDYNSFANNELTTQLTTHIIRAPQKAGQNPATKKPFTMEEASQNIKALITKVKSPSVSRLIGSVKIIRIGRISAFIKPKIKAATNAA